VKKKDKKMRKTAMRCVYKERNIQSQDPCGNDVHPIGTACKDGTKYMHCGCTNLDRYEPKWQPISDITSSAFLVVDGLRGGCEVNPNKYQRPPAITSLGPCLQAGGFRVEGFARTDAADPRKCVWDPSLPGSESVKEGTCREKHMDFKVGSPNYQDIVVLKDWANNVCNVTLTPPPGVLTSAVAAIDCTANKYGPGCPDCSDPFNLKSTCVCNMKNTNYNKFFEACHQVMDNECRKNPKLPLCSPPLLSNGSVDLKAIDCSSPDPAQLDPSCYCNPMNTNFSRFKTYCMKQAEMVGVDFVEHASWLGVNVNNIGGSGTRTSQKNSNCDINPFGPGCGNCSKWESLNPSCVCFPTNPNYPMYKAECEKQQKAYFASKGPTKATTTTATTTNTTLNCIDPTSDVNCPCNPANKQYNKEICDAQMAQTGGGIVGGVILGIILIGLLIWGLVKLFETKKPIPLVKTYAPRFEPGVLPPKQPLLTKTNAPAPEPGLPPPPKRPPPPLPPKPPSEGGRGTLPPRKV